MKPVERTVEVNGRPCRVWEAGEGEPLGYLAGLGGLPKWPPILDKLAEKRRVIAPSLPGYPGSLGHDLLDNQFDWALAAEALLRGAGLEGAAGDRADRAVRETRSQEEGADQDSDAEQDDGEDSKHAHGHLPHS